MIRSMTGYGRAEVTGGDFTLTVEARSLNHRHLDIALRLPRPLVSLDLQARKLVQAEVQRGRLDISVELRPLATGLGQVKVDQALAREYAELLRALAAELGLAGGGSLEWVLERPGVLGVGEPDRLDPEETWPFLAEALARAMGDLRGRRETEGAALAEALGALRDALGAEVERIAARAPAAVEQRTAALRERIRLLLADQSVDEGRIAMEAALMAQRMDITEELDRLRAHLDHFAGVLKEGGAVGRTLEFLIQELNREVNTVASKADDLEIARSAIAAKGVLEKLKEQVQNIE
jgi:uncharacterized protein (TIGR00255 family)